MDRREQEVLDRLREKTADVETPEKLRPENICQMLEEKDQGPERVQMIRKRTWKACALAAACVAVVSLAVWKMPDENRYLPDSEVGSTSAGRNAERSEGKAADGKASEDADGGSREEIACAKDYFQVYDYVKAYQESMRQASDVLHEESYEEDLYAEEAKSSSNADRSVASAETADGADMMADTGGAEYIAELGAADNASGEYSETNVRQEGVDEADIVKTDGRYLYVLEDNNKEIAVIDTKGQKMEKAASISVEDRGDNCSIYEFYVIPDQKKLALICGSMESQFMLERYPGYMGSGAQETTTVITYDIQDPSHPSEEGDVSQSGNYNSSRMADGYLYLFSEWGISIMDHMEPRDYIPMVNGESMKAENICLPPGREAYRYEIVTAVDLKKPKEVKDSIALFSKGGQIYVSNENIYYYETEWEYKDTVSNCVTTVRKVAYKDGELKAKVQGEFKGYLNDSFSIDEYKGNLRVVTTEGETNSVYVLDKNLKKIGSIKDLAEDERVYSARFMGEVGYFVTFRETDPLFSVDLSDPKNPKIVGELKIPGFSDYLHFYGEDRLLGIGMNVDEGTQITDGVKLSMFDISDKTDVKETDTYVLEHVYSTDVSYDYKAALIDPGRNIIGFSGYSMGGEKYFLFEFDEEEGFICNMEEDINGNGMSGTRGVYIKDILYVVQGNVIEAYGLKDYKKVDDLIL